MKSLSIVCLTLFLGFCSAAAAHTLEETPQSHENQTRDIEVDKPVSGPRAGRKFAITGGPGLTFGGPFSSITDFLLVGGEAGLFLTPKTILFADLKLHPTTGGDYHDSASWSSIGANLKQFLGSSPFFFRFGIDHRTMSGTNSRYNTSSSGRRFLEASSEGFNLGAGLQWFLRGFTIGFDIFLYRRPFVTSIASDSGVTEEFKNQYLNGASVDVGHFFVGFSY